MIDLGSMTDKFSEAGQKVARRAIELSKSRSARPNARKTG
jgi:hypothetical protein